PLGKREASFAEWKACRTDDACQAHPDDHHWGRGRRPVMNINFRDAEDFVRWLSRKTEQTYRLPTEAEWDYTCRAGTTTPFHFGETIGTDQANYDGNYTYGGGGKGVYRKKTVPVGNFPANAFGLHDMHGNVWEWVEDCWNGNYHGAPTDGSVWSSGDCSHRVLRGGSWYSKPGYMRSAARYGGHFTGGRINFVGFRVARTLSR
ncbi:MAG: formylglycine-generating enzyme family protein, partial [Verrucomicrobiota bacterium]|nr:formylglycine-generating enzyme family protein [Verrucomicrobiota bacterium]